ncbi:hypothetical protein G9C98_003200 [Cotesia typhae]|uniref:Uncharacterized protein n=1 Tax=Cotesia typhae TaxID=2053667 RepID=A0A8J5QR80_9HYME|nr:hypothetical protein G9C98_003200 [Cotesia typhae]
MTLTTKEKYLLPVSSFEELEKKIAKKILKCIKIIRPCCKDRHVTTSTATMVLDDSAHEEHPGHPGHTGHSGHPEHGSGPSPVPAAKQLLFAEYPLLKTPASTGKLTPVATSFVAPIPPLTYAAAPAVLTSYPAWSGLAALPATYSIEQHGYHITY